MKIRTPVSLFLASLVLALPRPPAAAQDLKQLARDAEASVLLLRILDRAGREVGSGTGFFVSRDGLLVTNHHVIEPAHEIEAIPADGSSFRILSVVAEDESSDLAVLRAETDRSQPLALSADDRLDMGERIVVLGGPLGLAGTLSEGIVSAVRDPSELPRGARSSSPLLQITAAISPGSSGSPVMKLDGTVVGVVVSQYRVGQNLNFAVPVGVLHKLLDQIGPDSEDIPIGGSVLAGNHYLRNVLISAVFFAILYLGFRRLT